MAAQPPRFSAVAERRVRQPSYDTLSLMKGPDNLDMRIARAWIDHTAAFWAWEELFNMGGAEKWHMIQVMVACAPDLPTLLYVAAGPVEDMMLNESMRHAMRNEAETNPRFRICLRGANGLPEEFQQLADLQSAVEPLPPSNAVEMTAREAAVMVGYFHHHDTSWAATLLEERIEQDPDAAWTVLKHLVKVGDDARHMREDIFLHAFEPFIRLNFATHQQHLKKTAERNEVFRRWLSCLKKPPTSDSAGWASFLRDIKSA